MTPTTLELQRTLECAVGGIHRIERKPCPYYSSCEIEELQVMLADRTVLPMIFKNLSAHAVVDEARMRPAFLYDSLREIEIYRSVLSRRSLGTARYFASVTKPDRYWLFVEKVEGIPLWQEGDLETWRNAARWLAELHRQPVSVPLLLRYDEDYYGHWWERAVRFHPKLQNVESVHDEAVSCLLDLPATFIHGEFYASNVLVKGTRICPVDWEMAASGPGLIDLAALIAGKWNDDKRLDLTGAYCGGIKPSNSILHALDCCRLHLTVRLLGWASDWQPPAAHAHDWLQQALEIAGRLA